MYLLAKGDQIGYGIPSGGALRISMDGAIEAIRKPLYRIERHGGNVARINNLAESNKALIIFGCRDFQSR